MADLGEESGTVGGGFVEYGFALRPVVADSGGIEEELGRGVHLFDGIHEETSSLDAGIVDGLLGLGIPASTAYIVSCQINDDIYVLQLIFFYFLADWVPVDVLFSFIFGSGKGVDRVTCFFNKGL